MQTLKIPRLQLLLLSAVVFSFSFFTAASASEDSAEWWDKKWSARALVLIDPQQTPIAEGEVIEGAPVLIRLHGGNFNFAAAREDASDLRFLADDGKTVLPHQVEGFDSLMNEGFVWVRVPEIQPGAPTRIWMYYGNPEGGSEVAVPFAETYDESTKVVFHFAERNRPAVDSSPAGNNASVAGSPAEGSLIGTGVRFLGRNPISIPATPSTVFPEGGDVTLSAWVRPQSETADAVWFSRTSGANALRLGLAGGIPYVETVSGGTVLRSSPSAEVAPLPVGRWSQLALIAAEGRMRLLLNGAQVAELESSMPALDGPIFLGGVDPEAPAGGNGFIGEMDEFTLASTARPVEMIGFAAINQSGSEESMRLVSLGEEEGGAAAGHNETLEHVMLFGDIAKNMMFDGWIAVGVCIIMIFVGWSVGIAKFFYLNKLQKGNQIFFRLWKEVTADLNLLDENKEDQMESLAAKLPKQKRLELKGSPLYHIYHNGLEEIESRLGKKAKVKMQGLSARSMQAIRASMDAGMVRENQRLNNGLVFLTIGIAGGPYVGLLGTVVGVMITFALIAKTGEVEVNSIAPGIASALLATVAGLVVAIPALFIYSYLSGRIKDTISSMEVFIDDFVAKIAEFYPPPSEKNFVPVPEVHVHTQNPPAPHVLSDGAQGEVPSSPSPTQKRH